MRYLILLFPLLAACENTQMEKYTESVVKQHDEAYRKGPKFHEPVCVRVTDKTSAYYGCKFFSHAEMFTQGEWQLVLNKKIRCIDHPTFMKESFVIKIPCPN